MPIKKAAKKYVGVTARKTKRNKKMKKTFREAIKKTKEAVAQNKADDAKKSLGIAIKSLDKAVQKGFIKKNTAARKKSRLNKLVKKISVKE